MKKLSAIILMALIVMGFDCAARAEIPSKPSLGMPFIAQDTSGVCFPTHWGAAKSGGKLAEIAGYQATLIRRDSAVNVDSFTDSTGIDLCTVGFPAFYDTADYWAAIRTQDVYGNLSSTAVSNVLPFVLLPDMPLPPDSVIIIVPDTVLVGITVLPESVTVRHPATVQFCAFGTLASPLGSKVNLQPHVAACDSLWAVYIAMGNVAPQYWAKMLMRDGEVVR